MRQNCPARFEQRKMVKDSCAWIRHCCWNFELVLCERIGDVDLLFDKGTEMSLWRLLICLAEMEMS